MPVVNGTLTDRKAVRWIEFTTMIGCSNNCTYCPQKTIVAAYGKVRPRMMIVETFDRLLDHLDPETTAIHFSGFSEIFLHPLGHEFIARACHRNFEVMLCSTLMGLTGDKIEYLMNNNVRFKWIRLHEFDGPGFVRDLFEVRARSLHDAGLTAMFKSARVVKPTSRGGNLWHPGYYAGPITCDRIQCNVVLPDGMVCLCCSDWGLRHIIGNLLDCDYDGPEFEAARRVIRMAAATSGSDVLCKTCELGKR